jgi:hypothetical protein
LGNTAAFGPSKYAGQSKNAKRQDANDFAFVYAWAMPFEVTTLRTFSASHQLKLYDGSLEPLHGHNWQVRVAVAAQTLDSIGVVIDFHELERLLDVLVSPMHNRHLNELSAFRTVNPSAGLGEADLRGGLGDRREFGRLSALIFMPRHRANRLTRAAVINRIKSVFRSIQLPIKTR